jgi:hypothetical protein
MRLNVALMNGLGVELPFHNDLGFFKALHHIAQLVLNVAGDVALIASVVSPAEPLHPEPGRHILVEEGRILFHGILESKNGGQHLVVHLDELEGLFGDVRTGSGHRCHGVTLGAFSWARTFSAIIRAFP